MVEGSLAGGLNYGLFNAASLASALSKKFKIELMIVGRVDGRTKNRLKHQNAFRIQFMDTTPRDHIPWLMRSSHLLFSAEVNPPCPNSVIEALACGLPVAGFETGSLSELVQGAAGRLVPYGGNPWRLQTPDIPAWLRPPQKFCRTNHAFVWPARERAESAFDVEKMVDEYSQSIASLGDIMTNDEIITFLKVHLQSIQDNDTQTYNETTDEDLTSTNGGSRLIGLMAFPSMNL